MTEPETGTPSTALPSASLDDRRTLTDLVLGGCIFLVAAGFWFWNSGPMSAPVAPPAATAAAPQPRPSDSFNNVGQQLFAAANYAAAEVMFRKAIAVDPDGALGYCNLGATLVEEHHYDEAITVLQRSVALDPSLTLARNNLSWALDEKRKAAK